MVLRLQEADLPVGVGRLDTHDLRPGGKDQGGVGERYFEAPACGTGWGRVGRDQTTIQVEGREGGTDRHKGSSP